MEEYLVDEEDLIKKMKEAKTSFAYGKLPKTKFQSLSLLHNRIQTIQDDVGYKTQNLDPTTKDKLVKLHKEFTDICAYMDDSFIE
ncbi:MAG: hypothetical protein ACXAD7_24520 [Candidatus Kariarchaeaceae archaeon]|jgi:hypothetical protein